MKIRRNVPSLPKFIMTYKSSMLDIRRREVEAGDFSKVKKTCDKLRELTN